jgi:membrane protein
MAQRADPAAGDEDAVQRGAAGGGEAHQGAGDQGAMQQAAVQRSAAGGGEAHQGAVGEGSPVAAGDTAGAGRPGQPGGASQRGRDAEVPSEVPALGWKDVAKRVNEQRKAKHTQLLASGVAFWAFLSLFPALIAAITLFGLFVPPEEVAHRVEETLQALPEEARAAIAGQLEDVARTASTALGIGLVVSLAVALWAASSAVANLMDAVNVVYHERPGRGFVARRGLAIVLTLGGILFGGLALAAIAAIPAVLRAAGLPGALGLLVWPVLGVLFAVGLAIIYRYAPNRADAEWRWVSPGAVVAVVIWAAGSIAFQFYVANFGNYDETYGSLAGVVILLFWLLLTSLAVLVGAHVNAELEAQTARDTTGDPDRPMGTRGAWVADNLGRIDGEADDRPDPRQADLGEDRRTRTNENVA